MLFWQRTDKQEKSKLIINKFSAFGGKGGHLLRERERKFLEIKKES